MCVCAFVVCVFARGCVSVWLYMCTLCVCLCVVCLCVTVYAYLWVCVHVHVPVYVGFVNRRIRVHPRTIASPTKRSKPARGNPKSENQRSSWCLLILDGECSTISSRLTGAGTELCHSPGQWPFWLDLNPFILQVDPGNSTFLTNLIWQWPRHTLDFIWLILLLIIKITHLHLKKLRNTPNHKEHVNTHSPATVMIMFHKLTGFFALQAGMNAVAFGKTEKLPCTWLVISFF